MADPQMALFVRFRSALSIHDVRRIAAERSDEFRALTGLRQKYYIHDPATGEVGGLYIWDTPEDLAAYRESELRATITEAYQVEGEPRLEVLRIMDVLRHSG